MVTSGGAPSPGASGQLAIAPNANQTAMSTSTGGGGFGAASTGMAATGASFGAASTGMPKRKQQASVVEMLEYVKGLDIDPIGEADMLWIAEEAFNAALPPGWSEHQDEQGRVYFHCAPTGESTWRHPMDELFREIVEYQRQVQTNGGFWQVEDEIAELEENIRKDLADWMELFDEHGEKFFYNKRTDQSRFDDPRMAVYHSLYARIKMVAKMKERLPILARAPRPEEPSQQEIELKKRQRDEEEKYLGCLIRIQTTARVMMARKKVRNMLAQATIQKGPQPLKGKLRLRMEKTGQGSGGRELVLSQTTPHKRNKCAAKIQARMRGVLTRKRFRPLVQHRAYLSKISLKIQSMARIWLARRRMEKQRLLKVNAAATKVQRCWRGLKDRRYVSSLRAERARFNHVLRSVVTIQSGIRMAIANKKVKVLKSKRFAHSVSLLQRVGRRFHALKDFQKHQLVQESQHVQAAFVRNEDPATSNMVPWTWQLHAAPWLGSEEGGERWVEGSHQAWMDGKYVDLFRKAGVASYRDVAAATIQKRVRGIAGRQRYEGLRAAGIGFVTDILNNVWAEIGARSGAAVRVQKIQRGKSMRGINILAQKKAERMKAVQVQLFTVQAHASRWVAQAWLHTGMETEVYDRMAVRLQSQWRAWMARRHVERLSEEALWPVKGWFEYTATGRDVVQLEVRFLANPSFDDFRYFMKNGSPYDLNDSIENMEAQLNLSIDKMMGSSGAFEKTYGERLMTLEESADAMPSRERKAAAAKEAAEVEPPPASKEVKKDDKKEKKGKKKESKEPSGERGKDKPEAEPEKPVVDEPARPDSKSKKQPAAKQPVESPPPEKEEEAAPPPEKKPEEPPKAKAAPAPEPAAPPAKAKAKAKAKEAPAPAKEAPAAAPAPPEEKAPAKEAPPPAKEAPPKAKEAPPAKKVEEAPKAKAKAKAAAPPPEPKARAAEAQPARQAPPPAAAKDSDDEDEKPPPKKDPLADSDEEDEGAKAPVAKAKAAPPARKEEEAFDGSYAHKFLREAQYRYQDRAPPRHPEDAKRSPSPKPPAKEAAPQPPSPTKATPGDMKASALRQAQSTPDLQADAPAAAAEAAPPPNRKTYGGTMKDGKFERTKAQEVEQMTDAEQQAILADLEAAKEAKLAAIKQQQRQHAARKKKEEAAKAEKMAALAKAEAEEEERRKKKVKELKKWLKKKQEEERARKERDEEMLQMVMQKEVEKSEALQKVEEERLKERERRLHQAEKQKAKLEAQLLLSREAASASKSMAKAEKMQALEQEPSEMPPAQPARVVHRHIHHHMHYHEGDQGGEGGPPNEERRKIEQASEARVRAQLEAQQAYPAKAGGTYPPYLPAVDSGAETPTMHRALSQPSMGGYGPPGMRISRTQEAFRQGALPPVDPLDAGRRNGLVNYSGSVQRAMGTYADSGRPRGAYH